MTTSRGSGASAARSARPVRVIAAGGTIAMRGERARPADDAAALVAAVPALATVPDLEAESVRNLPGAQVGLHDALAVALAARDAAREGRGVVVTTGTDTLEELALLADLVSDAQAPVVLTGAIRPGSAAGADGPANLLDAVAVAGAAETAGLGAVVVFGGQVHAARWVRKVDAVGPAAFGSFQVGPLGWVAEGRPAILVRPARRPALDVRRLDGAVAIVPAALGDDGRFLRAALAAGADGLVVVALGAGHVPPTWLEGLREAASRVPVVAVSRAERGAILRATYGFAGAEGDLRATGAIPAGRLAPAGARVTLLACLGAGLDRDAVRAVFAGDDQ
jgi:L-asparaginase